MSNSTDKETAFFKSQLVEGLKKDPIYKDNGKGKEIVNDNEDVHNAVSDLLLRVLSKKEIENIDYALGLNPVKLEKKDSQKKSKLKESLLEEDDDLGLDLNLNKEDDASVTTDSSNSEDSSKTDDAVSVKPTEDELDNSDKEDNDEEKADEPEDVLDDSKNKGVGAFERIVDECEKDEILLKAISALNCHDINAARKEFYDWFDTYDDEHKEDSSDNLNKEDNDTEDLDLDLDMNSNTEDTDTNSDLDVNDDLDLSLDNDSSKDKENNESDNEIDLF